MSRKTTSRVATTKLFSKLVWIDETPLLSRIEPYRRRIFSDVLDDVDVAGRPKYNLALMGRAKKNWKSADLCLAAALLPHRQRQPVGQ